MGRYPQASTGNEICCPLMEGTPPILFQRFFKWFCRKDLHRYVEGDLLELYEERLLNSGKRTADLRFIKDVLLLFRPDMIRPFKGFKNLNNNAMFRNYFKTSFRSLMKSPLTSFINIFGLAVGIGVCMVTYAFMDFDYSIDRYHEFKDEVYLTTFNVDREGTEETYGTTPAPLGAMLRDDFSMIHKVCRIHDGGVVVKYGENVFNEQIRYADPEFLQMFTFPLKWGTGASLGDINSVILSQEMAIKYFGAENPMGQDIKVIFGEGNTKTFKVSGVADQFQKARIIDFGFLVNIENLEISNSEFNFLRLERLSECDFHSSERSIQS